MSLLTFILGKHDVSPFACSHEVIFRDRIGEGFTNSLDEMPVKIFPQPAGLNERVHARKG